MPWFLVVMIIVQGSGTGELIRPDIMFKSKEHCEQMLPVAIREVHQMKSVPIFTYGFCITAPGGKTYGI